MNETGKRKEWIKNVAIIFLAVLLVLTFFSNTIKNYSLPEVAAQYTYSGSITNKVRGNAVVEASDPYSVVFKADRKVGSVSVRVGDVVKKGDILYVLEEGESEDLKAARRELEAMQNAYEKNLVLGEISKDLTAKVENGNMGTTQEMQDKIAAAKKKVENAKSYLESLQKQQASAGTTTESEHNKELQGYIDNMNDKIIPEVDGRITKYTGEVADAEDDYLAVVNSKISVQGNSDVEIVETLAEYLSHFSTNAVAYSLSDAERASIDKALYGLGSKATSVDGVKTAISLVAKLCEKDSDLSSDNQVSNVAGVTVSSELKAVKTYDLAVKNNSVLAQKSVAIDDAKKKLADEQTNLANCKNQITLWENEKTKTESVDYTTKISDAQSALEKAEKAYSDLVSDITTSYDLIDQLDKIEDKKAEIAKLEKEQGADEITAPVDGMVLSMNYTAGQTIEAGSTVSTIQIAGKGYTMSVSVTNDKVRLISVGDEAEITNSWWYSDVHARIISIRPDPNSPSQSKLVTFELDGDVSNGQSLSFSVGKKSANYENIVPNSAIHEDNKGKFIYKINSKSTPLGNRYIIERVDVTVLASDDSQSAVSGALEGWDFIATTASKPIEDGTEVRLKD